MRDTLKSTGHKVKEVSYTAYMKQKALVDSLRDRMRVNTFIVQLLIVLVALMMAIIVWLLWK